MDGRKTAVEVSLSAEAKKLLRTSASSEACVIVLAGAKIGQHAVLAQPVVEIGRSPRCGVQVDVPSVSRLHAHIEWEGTHHVLVDSGSTNGTFVGQTRVTRHALRDGEQFAVGNVVLKYLAHGNIEGAYHQEIQRLATHDGLTGAANKGYFNDTLRDAVARTRVQPLPITLVVFDLDHFKRVNDEFGHSAGDEVLRQTAALAQARVSERQLFGRVGGEEFAVMCLGQELGAGVELAESLRKGVADTRYVFDGAEIPVTLSAGVAMRTSAASESAEALFGRADEQLYRAKATGRNRVCA